MSEPERLEEDIARDTADHEVLERADAVRAAQKVEKFKIPASFAIEIMGAMSHGDALIRIEVGNESSEKPPISPAWKKLSAGRAFRPALEDALRCYGQDLRAVANGIRPEGHDFTWKRERKICEACNGDKEYEAGLGYFCRACQPDTERRSESRGRFWVSLETIVAMLYFWSVAAGQDEVVGIDLTNIIEDRMRQILSATTEAGLRGEPISLEHQELAQNCREVANRLLLDRL